MDLSATDHLEQLRTHDSAMCLFLELFLIISSRMAQIIDFIAYGHLRKTFHNSLDILIF